MKKILKNEDFWKILGSLVLFGVSFLVDATSIWYFLLIVLSYIIVAWDLFVNSFENIRNKEWFDENTLMIIATIGAFFIHEYPEAIMVVVLYRIGEALSDLAVSHSRESVVDLMDLKCDTVRLLLDGEEVVVDPHDAKIGDLFVVRPGEKIALDGIVVKGEAFLDTSSLTGESVPRKVKMNDPVLSGAICQDQVLTIKATTIFENSTSEKILELIENSGEKKANTEKFITRFAKVYTPIVVLLAVVILFVSWGINKDINGAIYTACVFLVMSCPCALVISVPLSYFSGIGRASKEGILIKGGSELDRLRDIKIVAFDKTGTITEGVFEVQKIVSPTLSEDVLLEIAAYGEYNSNHPIAKSVLTKYKKKIVPDEILDFEEIHGKGIRFRKDNKTYYLGNETLFKEKGIEIPMEEDVGTIVYVAENREYIGHIVIADKIKDESYKIVSDLKDSGVEDFVLLSGDSKKIVESVASKVHISHYEAELLPIDKVRFLEKWKKKGCTAFIGDGINDAPVIRQADVGIAMGGVGSDATIDASDVVFMNDDVSLLKKAIDISKYTHRLILINIWFAIFIKVLVLILSVLGMGAIWLAVLADVGVTIICVLHTLSILKRKF